MDSLYGGRPGTPFVIKAAYSSIDAMKLAFMQGDNYSDVWYGEYCIVDTLNKNDPDNGKIFRRGIDYPNDGDAIYIGQIVGPQGNNPYISMRPIDDVKEITKIAVDPTGEADGAGKLNGFDYTKPDFLSKEDNRIAGQTNWETTPVGDSHDFWNKAYPIAKQDGNGYVYETKYNEPAGSNIEMNLTQENLDLVPGHIKAEDITSYPGQGLIDPETQQHLDPNWADSFGEYDNDGNVNNTNIKYTWCNVRKYDPNKGENEAWLYIGFRVPYLVIDFTETQTIDQYDENGNYTDLSAKAEETTKLKTVTKTINGKKYEYKVAENPFYRTWQLSIPKGIKGDSLDSVVVGQIAANGFIDVITSFQNIQQNGGFTNEFNIDNNGGNHYPIYNIKKIIYSEEGTDQSSRPGMIINTQKLTYNTDDMDNTPLMTWEGGNESREVKNNYWVLAYELNYYDELRGGQKVAYIYLGIYNIIKSITATDDQIALDMTADEDVIAFLKRIQAMGADKDHGLWFQFNSYKKNAQGEYVGQDGTTVVDGDHRVFESAQVSSFDPDSGVLDTSKHFYVNDILESWMNPNDYHLYVLYASPYGRYPLKYYDSAPNDIDASDRHFLEQDKSYWSIEPNNQNAFKSRFGQDDQGNWHLDPTKNKYWWRDWGPIKDNQGLLIGKNFYKKDIFKIATNADPDLAENQQAYLNFGPNDIVTYLNKAYPHGLLTYHSDSEDPTGEMYYNLKGKIVTVQDLTAQADTDVNGDGVVDEKDQITVTYYFGFNYDKIDAETTLPDNQPGAGTTVPQSYYGWYYLGQLTDNEVDAIAKLENPTKPATDRAFEILPNGGFIFNKRTSQTKKVPSYWNPVSDVGKIKTESNQKIALFYKFDNNGEPIKSGNDNVLDGYITTDKNTITIETNKEPLLFQTGGIGSL